MKSTILCTEIHDCWTEIGPFGRRTSSASRGPVSLHFTLVKIQLNTSRVDIFGFGNSGILDAICSGDSRLKISELNVWGWLCV